ncbi:hypothetical protein LZK73_18600 [Neorhizobium galegae]|nr:hypothetical protein LZK73_18600 [Neorhizobium galegae]
MSASYLEDIIRSAGADIAAGEKLSQDIDRVAERLAALRASLKDRPSMKYALESLPELIGADDYADLCELMGMTDWTRQEIPTGPEFARRIRSQITGLQVRREVKRSSQTGALL